MEKKLIGKAGTSIEIITNKVRAEIRKENIKHRNKKQRKPPKTMGTLFASDWKNLCFGLEILEEIIREGLRVKSAELLSGEKDVGKLQKEILNYRSVINAFLDRIDRAIKTEYFMSRNINSLEEQARILQAARDGVIIKQEQRTEIIEGKEKNIFYDTSITQKEVQRIMYKYYDDSYEMLINKFNNYLGLGFGVAETLGYIITSGKNNQTKEKISLMTVATISIAILKLMASAIKVSNREEENEAKQKRFNLEDDLFENETISYGDQEQKIENIKLISKKEKRLKNKTDNKIWMTNTCLNIVTALMSGIYVNKQIKINENGKIDGKSLATALMNLQNSKSIANNFLVSINSIINSKEGKEDYEENCKKLKSILEQMEEKVYPLEGAKNPFDSIEIKNFTGKFYPKKDYETGKINYSTVIQVPEFSMKRGDVVLLSGESGAGKSTFLRFLKRGDINNRKAIKLDNGEMIDNLGKEYIAFRPSINLGDETNVLYQITGKENITNLTKKERKKLLDILVKLKFNSPNLLEEIASKKFLEFSTGQQKRLALSKIFYRINDGTSVIIVDEPVGNVEDSLIREQLEMIKEYAESRNVMLILTTHRIDLAKDLATKQYHIDNNGLLKQVPLKKREDKTNDGR